MLSREHRDRETAIHDHLDELERLGQPDDANQACGNEYRPPENLTQDVAVHAAHGATIDSGIRTVTVIRIDPRM